MIPQGITNSGTNYEEEQFVGQNNGVNEGQREYHVTTMLRIGRKWVYNSYYIHWGYYYNEK